MRNSLAGKAEQGLEISVISVVEVETRLAYTLTVQQTPKRPESPPSTESRQVKTKKTLKSRHKTSSAITPKTD